MSKQCGNEAVNASAKTGWVLRTALVILLSITALSALAPSRAAAQTYQFNSVQVDGNERIADASVVSFAGIGSGQTLSAGELNAAYQRVLQTGLFKSVEFVPQGNQLLIKVVEFPTINVISVEGNKRIDDEAAMAVITAQPRRVLNPSQIEQDAAALTELYSFQGRLAATVTPRLIERSDNRVDVVFEVIEGNVSEVERISFVGNKAFSESRLRRVFATKQAGVLHRIISRDTFIEDRIELDKQLLRDFYLARGYVDFEILSVASEFSRERNAFFLTVTVKEGQKFSFGQITASSDLPEVDEAAFLAMSKIRPGTTYSPLWVENTIARMENLAVRQGLNFIRVDPQITRNDRDLTLDVNFALVRGPRIFVERIDIEGNATTLDRVVRREFKTVEGDPFNPREIRESAERIRALGLFTTADVEARQGTADDQVIVDVNVDEALTGSLSFGATYSTNDGIGLTVGFSERNFLGRGQFLSVNLNFGLDSGESGVRFVEPRFLGRDLSFSLDATYIKTSYDYTDYDTKAARFSPGFDFPISENGRFGVRYALTDQEIFNVDRNSSSVLKDEEAEGSLLGNSLGYSYSYDNRRNGLNPETVLSFRFSQDLTWLENDAKFVKSEARAIAERKVLSGDVTLRATVEGGALISQDGDSRLNDRFFLGSNRVRGFAPAGVGPRDLTVKNEDVLGGNYYAAARFETEFPIGVPEEYGITGGLFYDVGSVWGLDNTAGGKIDDDAYLRSSIGLSVFWTTAIGPLRFNFSKALSKKSYDETQVFDLTISTQF